MDLEEQLQKVIISPREPLPIRKKSPAKRFLIPATLLIVLTFSSAVYFLNKQNTKNSEKIEGRSEVQVLIDEVSKLIALPTDEEPTIATVSDPAVLKNQQFFAQAKAGDKVLIYAKAKKAILYDPIAKKIIEVAPLNIGDIK